MASLYSNENFPRSAVLELRSLGHDVVTSLEAGQANQGISDDAVVQYANAAERIVVTLNRKDFINIHRTRSDHMGIIVCKVDPDSVALANRIHHALLEHNPAQGKLIRVNKNGHTVDA